MSNESEGLGKPDVELAGLRVWVHSRNYPNSSSYWDGNWLNVTIECSGQDAIVRVSGSIVLAWELADLLSGLEKLHSTLSGDYELECMEPHLSLTLKTEKTGKIEFVVKLTPDFIHQKHSFKFDIDQSYLPETIRQLRELLRTYPVRNAGGPKAMQWLTTNLPAWVGRLFGVRGSR